jgi:hypothetical protein
MENIYENNKMGKMEYIHKALNAVMGAWAVYLIINGYELFSLTNHSVEGSNFSMLITIVNILAQLLILVGIKAIDMAIMALMDSENKNPNISNIIKVENTELPTDHDNRFDENGVLK